MDRIVVQYMLQSVHYCTTATRIYCTTVQYCTTGVHLSNHINQVIDYLNYLKLLLFTTVLYVVDSAVLVSLQRVSELNQSINLKAHSNSNEMSIRLILSGNVTLYNQCHHLGITTRRCFLPRTLLYQSRLSRGYAVKGNPR